MSPICRVTMIKVEEEKLGIVLEGFKTFTKSQSKDGKPYILSMEAGPVTGGHVKDQGFTLVTKSIFKSKSDMNFYEQECPAHEKYKVFLKMNAPVTELMTVCFEPKASFTL